MAVVGIMLVTTVGIMPVIAVGLLVDIVIMIVMRRVVGDHLDGTCKDIGMGRRLWKLFLLSGHFHLVVAIDVS